MRRLSCVLLAGLLGVTLLQLPVSATFPGENGKIAFARDGIVLARTDGTGMRQLTDDQDFNPAFSPGGDKIAFIRNSETDAGKFTGHIYVMRSDGSNLHRVSGRMRGFAQPPVWSPNGRWVAFEDFVEIDPDLPGGESHFGAIKVVRANGTDLERLTGYGSRNFHPSWSPDSQQLVFGSNRDGDSEIFVIGRDGSNLTQLTNNDVGNDTPNLSPDGQRIVFTQTVDEDPAPGDDGVAIMIMDADGTGQVALTDGTRADSNPQWNPMGTTIAFAALGCFNEPSCPQDLWTIAPDGSAPTNVTEDIGKPVDYAFAWAPDSTKFAFGSNGDIYTIDLGTGTQTTVSKARVYQSLGDWQAR